MQAVEHELERQQKIIEIENLIKKFQHKVDDEWNSDKFSSENPNKDCVFNKCLLKVRDWSEVKYIIVADNPGKNERKKSRYLVSDHKNHLSSGSIAKAVFDYIGIKGQYIVLNKCPIYTKETEDLKKYDKKDYELLKTTQENMAELTFELHMLLCELHVRSIEKPKVYIFGLGDSYDLDDGWLATIPEEKNGRKNSINRIGQYYAGQIMRFYFAKIRELYKQNSELQKSLFIMKHFSRWQIFSDISYTEEFFDEGRKEVKISATKRVKLKMLIDEKVEPQKLIDALESLEYKDELFK